MDEFNLNTFIQDNNIQLEDRENISPSIPSSMSTGFSLQQFLAENPITTIEQEADEYTESEAYAHAAWLGLSDTGRGVLQFMGIAEEGMQEDKAILKALEKKYGSGITATYIGGMIADPVGWVVPVAKARTVGKLAWEGAKWGGLAGGLGYVDEEAGYGLDALPEKQSRPVNAIMGAVSGAVVAPVFGKAIQGAGKIKDLVMNKNADEIFDNPVAALAEIGEAPSSMAQNIKSAYIKPFQRGDSSDKDRTNWAHRAVFSNPGVFLGGATGGALGGAQEHDSPAANIFGWTVAGAAMGATGFRAVGAIGPGLAKKSTNNFMGRMAKGEGTVADYMANAFIENHGLKARFADVIKMKEDNFADANNIGYQFLDIAEQMSKLKPEESKLLYQFLDGRLGKTDLTPDLLTMGEDARKAITEAGQRLVDVGALNKDVWLKNIDSYIHRSYLKHLPEGKRASTWKQIWANDNVRLMADELRMRGIKREYIRPKEGVEAWRKEKAAEGWEFLPNAAKEKRKDAFRYDYTPEQRAEMGEIENASYAMLETGKLYTNDIATLGLYNDVFKAHARVDVKKFKALNKKANEMLAQGRFTDDTLTTGKEEAAEAAKNLWVRERTPEQGLAIDAAEAERLGLKLVPETNLKGTKIKLFGKLSGSYIPKEIHSDLIAFKGTVNFIKDNENSLIKASRKMFQSYRLGNQMWKRSKTSWNPTVHTNNIMSNFILMDLLNVPYKYINVGRHVFTDKGRKLLDSKYDNLYKDLTRFGVLDAGLAKQELGFASNKWADAYQDKLLKEMKSPEEVVEGAARIANKIYKEVKNPLNPVLKFGKILDTEATRLYGKEDQMFRIALYKHRLDEGMKRMSSVKGTPEFDRELDLLKRNAAKQAKRGFIDYDIQAPGIKVLRETFNPFISYTYRVIPLLAEAATLRPMKFAKWAAIGYTLNFAGRELSESNEEAERGMMSSQALQHMFGVPFMPYSTIKMPDRVGKLFTMGFDEDPLTGKKFPNRSMYGDVNRWIPGGDVLGLTGQGGAEGMRIPGLPAPLQPSGGLMGDIFFSLVMGQDAFTGKKINSVQEGFYYKQLARGKHLLRKLTPNNPLIGDFGLFADEDSFRSYSQRKILRALNSGEVRGTLPGRYDLPVLQAVAQTIGIKLYPFEPRVEEQLRTFEYKKKRDRFKSEARRILRQIHSRVMSREEGTKKIDELQQQLLEEVILKYRKMKKSASKIKGYKEGGVIDLDTPEEKEFDTDIHQDLWKEKFSEDIKRIEREEEEARPRIIDIYKLTELEKAVDIDKEGLTEAARYMQDYGTRRAGRISDQLATNKMPRDPWMAPVRQEGEQAEIGLISGSDPTPGELSFTKNMPDILGSYTPKTKRTYNAPHYYSSDDFNPRDFAERQDPRFIDKASSINTEQHEALHAFLDMLRTASLDDNILGTLPHKEQIRLLSFLDFLQEKSTPIYSDEKMQKFKKQKLDIQQKYRVPDHAIMNLPDKYKRVTDPETGQIIGLTQSPFHETPDDPEGLGRLETINKIAKALNIAAAKNPKIHKEFIKAWEKGGMTFIKKGDSYRKKLLTTPIESFEEREKKRLQREDLQQMKEEEEEERKSREAAEGFASKFLPKKNKRDLATQMAALRRKG